MSFFFPNRAKKRIEHVAALYNVSLEDNYVHDTDVETPGDINNPNKSSIHDEVSKGIKLIAAIDDKYVLNKRDKIYARMAVFPSWKKTIAVALITILLLALAATGVGALAGLGVFGATLAGLAVSKLALSLISMVAAKLAISTFTLAAVTAGISGLLANFAVSEWLEPGKLFYSFAINKHVADTEYIYPFLQINKNSKEPWENLIRQLVKIIFFPIYIIPGLIAAPFFLLYFHRKEMEAYAKNDDKVLYDAGYSKHLIKNYLKIALNPLRWIEETLLFVERVLFRILELNTWRDTESSQPLKIVKGLINALFQLAIIPIGLLKPIGDIPFFILKTTFYTIPATIFSLLGDCFGRVGHSGGYKPVPNPEEEMNNTNNPGGSYHQQMTQTGAATPIADVPTQSGPGVVCLDNPTHYLPVVGDQYYNPQQQAPSAPPVSIMNENPDQLLSYGNQ